MPADRGGRPSRRADRWRGPLVAYGLPLLVVVVAAGFRFVALGHPDRIHFDEVFYANDANAYLEQGVEEERPAHPPAGKWPIAVGIAVAGFDPFGWRVAAAVAGTATVGLTYLLGRRLLGGSRLLAALAALLVAIDGVAVTMSRIAMLDVFQGLFVALGAWLLVVALQAGSDVVAGRARLGAGAALGLAVATKWSGGLALVAAVVVVAVALAVSRRRRAADGDDARPGVGRAVAGRLLLPFVLVPAAVYVASYAGWFAAYPSPAERFACADDDDDRCEPTVAGAVSNWVDEQLRTVRFHRNLITSHPYRSSALGWPVLARPVLTYLERCPEEGPEPGEECAVPPGTTEKILVLGNPGLWWLALPAYAALAVVGLRRRDPWAGVIGAFLVLQWAPWLLSPKDGFPFYLTPAVPFVALALAWAVGRVPRRRLRAAVGAGVVVAAVAGAAYLAPLWLGTELPTEASEDRLLFPSWR